MEDDNINVEVADGKYTELAEDLRDFWVGRNTRLEREYDSMGPTEYDIVVDSWSSGALLRVEQGDKVPSFDRKWVQVALQAGYFPHGHICRSDGSQMKWYLKPLDRLDAAISTAEGKVAEEQRHVGTSFEDYVYELVQDSNEVVECGGNVYHIQHTWFDTGEIDALRDDDGVVVQGINAQDGHIVVEDDR